ncbi:hypothetical protein LTR12_012645 [Friedmanniomyces endolithicus]|nr:hypothetical protein LTR12_012645 [Friedmanniomyces endolithicus]
MGVTKKMITPGNGTDKPKSGDTITMEYTGICTPLRRQSTRGSSTSNSTLGSEHSMGLTCVPRFDSSVGRGDFQTKIGVGQVIKGWDEGVLSTDGGMTLGEKSTLTITGFVLWLTGLWCIEMETDTTRSDYAYGDRGFPGLIPKNATLIFDVQLKGINGKKM